MSSMVSYGENRAIKSFSCINAVKKRAMRFFLGIGKYTPTAAVSGDMGWTPAFDKQWKCIEITGTEWYIIRNSSANSVNQTSDVSRWIS